MILYILIFLFVLLLSFWNKGSLEKKYFYILFMALGILVGLGDMLGGYDRYIYGELFDDEALRLMNKDAGGSNLFDHFGSEPGYCYFNVIISFITINRYIFIFIFTMVMYALMARYIFRYCEKNLLALVVFLGVMFFFTFTYLRQMMACAIVWWAIKYMMEHKPLKFVLVMALAFSFHNAVVIFLPCYFIPTKKINRNIIILLCLIALILGLFSPIGDLFDAYGEMMGDEERAELYRSDLASARITYFFEAVVFLSFILPFYKLIPNDKKSCIMLNLAIIFCIVLLLFIRSENGGRLAWLFMIGLMSTFSTIAGNSKRGALYPITLSLLCLMLYIRIVVAWGVLLSPYKTFLTNGVRSGDFIYEKFEYDHNYEIDKLYK